MRLLVFIATVVNLLTAVLADAAPWMGELTIRDESPGLVTLSIISPRPDSQVKPGDERPSAAAGPISLEATARLNCFAETGAVQAEATEP